MPSTPSSPRDSQEALALSIARAVQLELPAPDSEVDIRTSVTQALIAEACRNERILALLRAGLLGAAALLGLVAHLHPSLVGLARYPLWPVLVALAGTAAALGFLHLLSRGWYRPWLRRIVPGVDALGILLAAALFEQSLGGRAEPVPGGGYGAAAVACAFLAASGALRLSRSSARVATLLAVLAWLGIWWLWALPWLTSAFTTGLILAVGLLATHIARVIRRVITDEVARVRLVHLYERAQEAINAREEVLRIVSHDLRNPLGTIAMATDLLLEMPVPEDQRRKLGIIKRQGERMKILINDLLDVARIEAGRLPIRPETICVSDLIDPVVEMMRPLAADKRLELHVAVPDGLPMVRADPERINQVFSNLIGNAIKFTPEGGHITLTAQQMGEKVRFAVVDTGPGIPPESLSDIFGRMWQARKDDGRGIGLGLTIAQAIVEAHGERIGVESRLGQGTEFWFTAAVVEQPSPATVAAAG